MNEVRKKGIGSESNTDVLCLYFFVCFLTLKVSCFFGKDDDQPRWKSLLLNYSLAGIALHKVLETANLGLGRGHVLCPRAF